MFTHFKHLYTMTFLKCLTILFMSLCETNGLYTDSPIVNTSLGEIRGLIATDGDYFMYLGIPYALVNQSNPFGESIPFPEFPNGFEATSDQEFCPQLLESTGVLAGSIECLNLNIYVPRSCEISESNRYPVLVYIYGGEFLTGCNLVDFHGPKYLVRHNIIVIMISYRLGPYGFMCLDTEEVPGNQGLKDQATALRWIRNYIHYFGGDSNKITVSGHSSGSASIDFHLHSRQELLFQQAILEGGNSLFPDIYKSMDRTIPFKLAAEIGFKTEDLNEALSFLAKTDPLKVISASIHLNLKYGPCIEKYFNNVEMLVPDSSINLDVPKVQNVSIIIGQTDDEMAYLFKRRWPLTDHIYSIGIKRCFTFDEDRLSNMEEIVRRYYIGDDTVSEDNKVQVGDFVSDICLNHANKRIIQKYLSNGASKIYYSIFAYKGGRNLMRVMERLDEGNVMHGDELGYIFTCNNMFTDVPSSQDQHIIDKITTLWTNFVKYGDPTPEISQLLPVRWTPVNNNSYHYLTINSELSMAKNPFCNRMQFWDIFYLLNQEFQKGIK